VLKNALTQIIFLMEEKENNNVKQCLPQFTNFVLGDTNLVGEQKWKSFNFCRPTDLFLCRPTPNLSRRTAF
jgi:hypothetical protein